MPKKKSFKWHHLRIYVHKCKKHHPEVRRFMPEWFPLLPASLFLSSDKTLALSHQGCGGNVGLDQEPAGHINLTLPGLFTDANRLNPMSHRSGETLLVSVCTWIISIPPGRTVLLKLVWLESGLNVSVRCVWNEEGQALESGGVALLSGCDGNKATLTWTGAGNSSNSIKLSYYGEKLLLNYPVWFIESVWPPCLRLHPDHKSLI